MKQLHLDTLDHLVNLSLRKCLASHDHVSFFCDSLKLHKICKLDLSRTPALSGIMGVLLANPFPWLANLHLGNCGLQESDLSSLAIACNKDKIPQMKHLDISDNPDLYHCLNAFFENKCTWNQLLTLNFRDTLAVNEHLNNFVASGCLSSLQELTACKLNNWTITTKWQNLQKLCVYGCDKDALETIVHAFEKGFLHSLNTLCVQHPFSCKEFLQIDTVKYLLECNINVHNAQPGTIAYPFQTATCVCQSGMNSKGEHSPAKTEHSPFKKEHSSFKVDHSDPKARQSLSHKEYIRLKLPSPLTEYSPLKAEHSVPEKEHYSFEKVHSSHESEYSSPESPLEGQHSSLEVEYPTPEAEHSVPEAEYSPFQEVHSSHESEYSSPGSPLEEQHLSPLVEYTTPETEHFEPDVEQSGVKGTIRRFFCCCCCNKCNKC